MQNNFDLQGYLRKNNKLLNESFEGFGGYKDLNPLKEDDQMKNEADGPMGMPDVDPNNPWMEDVDGTEAYKVGEWTCYYDYPGHLVWSYGDKTFDEIAVYATPGFDDVNFTPIQVEKDQTTVAEDEINKGAFRDFKEYAKAMMPHLKAVEERYLETEELEELEKPEKIYADDEEDDSAEQTAFDRAYQIYGMKIEKVLHEMITMEDYEPEDAVQFLRDFADHIEQGNITI